MKTLYQILKEYDPDQPRAPKGISEGGQWVADNISDKAIDYKVGSVADIVKSISTFEKDLSQYGAVELKVKVASALDHRLKENQAFKALVEKENEFTKSLPENWRDLNSRSETNAYIGSVIGQWAATSSDSNTASMVVQLAAKDLFNLEDSRLDHLNEDTYKKAVEIYKDKTVSEGVKTILKAQYDATQEYFASMKVKEIYAARGAGFGGNTANEFDEGFKKGLPIENPMGELAVVSEGIHTQPLSSFSTDVEIATLFATSAWSDEFRAKVSFVKIPISKVFSTPLTGVGCQRESELVVLGGKVKAVSIYAKKKTAMWEVGGHLDSGASSFRELADSLPARTRASLYKGLDKIPVKDRHMYDGWTKYKIATEYLKAKSKKSLNVFFK